MHAEIPHAALEQERQHRVGHAADADLQAVPSSISAAMSRATRRRSSVAGGFGSSGAGASSP
jgi:hypothetical protein